ncbi:hypothetical protein DWX41_02880 [Hungatella hathewayi]|uniref:Uncharacterized protein n=1 Tax=Hungatella hathewayi TaxID=154046 RepID=A0A3E2X2V3_9FIRM|nr:MULTISPECIES: hypothetical protein [Clostridia]RGC35146.1 hypothetical protein DWX41_02880 [Hungatella hathewayi]GKH35122.1 hypothetical protein CE91St64_45290 [Faecalicatena contorta]
MLRKFEALQLITDVKKYSELVFDLVTHTGTPEKLTKLLDEEFSDKGLQTVESISRSDYPLSLGRKQ